MESTPTPTPAPARRIDVPLRLRAIAQRDPSVAARVLDLDRKLQEVAREASVARDRVLREGLFRAMVELRVELDSVIATAIGAPLPTGEEPSALTQVPRHVREQLARLLGVPLEPEFHPVLERKAEEWLEQGRAFDEIASEFGFVEATELAASEPRGALVLTYNGSLVQMSAPKDDAYRRFVYQSIYVNAVPSEGALRLGGAVRVDARMRATAMDTSPIRKLRVATRRASWARERETFSRISAVLTPPSIVRPERSTVWGLPSSFVPALGRSEIDRARVERDDARAEQARLAARVELAALVERLASDRPRSDTLDVEILGVALHLQRLEVERGRRPFTLAEGAVVVTDRDERLVVEGTTLRLEREGRRPRTFPRAALGEQLVVERAPLLLLDERGAVVAILGDVKAIR